MLLLRILSLGDLMNKKIAIILGSESEQGSLNFPFNYTTNSELFFGLKPYLSGAWWII